MSRRGLLITSIGLLVIGAAVVFLVVHGSVLQMHGRGADRGIHAFNKPGDAAAKWRQEVAQRGYEKALEADQRAAASQQQQQHGRDNVSHPPPPTGAVQTTIKSAGQQEPKGVAKAALEAMDNAGGHDDVDNKNASAPDEHGRVPRHLDPLSLFVSIASYRDEECAPTIVDMYEKAKNPRSLYLGVVEQHDFTMGDPPCVPNKIARIGTQPGAECKDTWCPGDNIRVAHINPRQAEGPTFGRFHGAKMYGGEKYYMMIDSHNRFVTGWDDIAIRMYKALPSQKGVLSHYPEAWNNPRDKQAENAPLDNRPTTTYLCNIKFVEHLGYPRLDGFVVPKRQVSRPQPWAAAGFLFADAKLLEEVPFDPHLHFVFDGEEILYSVRMWTHGWDIFSPSENVLYHYYYRIRAHKFWSLLPGGFDARKAAAERRIQRMLQTVHKGTNQRHVPDDSTEETVIADLDKYGLGTERTLAQYYEFAGIDRVNFKLTKNWCQKHS